MFAFLYLLLFYAILNYLSYPLLWDFKLQNWLKFVIILPQFMTQLVESIERIAEIAKAGGFSTLGKDLMKAAKRQKDKGFVPETEGVVFDRRLDSNQAKKPLTPNERRLVRELKEKPNQVISTAKLHEKIYGQKKSRGIIKKLVFRTRGKIEDDPKNPKFIVTKFREGYLWKDTRYSNSELTYDPDRFLLVVAGKEIYLHGKQRGVFGLLVENSGNVVTHEVFSAEVWGLENKKRLEIQCIDRIQRKVRKVTQKKLKSIVSVPGIGYRLDDPGEIENAPVTVFEKISA